MGTSVKLAGIIAISSAIYFVFMLEKWYSRAKQARNWGCKNVFWLPFKLPFGIDYIMRMNKADQKHMVPQETMKCYLEAGRPTFAQSVLGSAVITTHDPKNIQHLLALQFSDFELGPNRRNSFFPMLGNGIFTADGTMWEHSRALLRPQFGREQVSDLSLEERHVQAMFIGLEARASSWTDAIDLSPFFFRLTIDSATEFLFGESINSQSAAFESQVSLSPDSSTWNWSSLAACFDRGTAALGVRARLGSMYWLHDPALFRKDCSKIHQFADHCVSQALNRKKADAGDHGVDRYIFLDELVKTTTDPIELRSQLLNILLAGRDTTAGLLGWIFWCLARHPVVLRKLRATILDDFGTYEEPRSLTFSTLKSCKYLQQVIKETLRLFPSVPMNLRQATKNTTLPVGGGQDGSAPIYVRAGQEVSYSVYVMHRRKDIWGADAEEFNPDRWAGRKVGWEYLPFNGGPRLCLGQQFALTEVGYVLVRMLQRFDDVRNCDNSDVPLHQYSVTTAPKKVWVQLHRPVRGEGMT